MRMTTLAPDPDEFAREQPVVSTRHAASVTAIRDSPNEILQIDIEDVRRQAFRAACKHCYYARRSTWPDERRFANVGQV